MISGLASKSRNTRVKDVLLIRSVLKLNAAV